MNGLRSETSFEDVSSYVEYRCHHFLRYNVTLLDIYLKLSDVKYIKILNQGASYSPSEIMRLISRGALTLYVKAEDYAKFKTRFSTETFLQLKKGSNDSVTDQWEQSFKVVKALLEGCEISDAVYEMVFTQVRTIRLLITRRPEYLANVVYKQWDNGHFLADHSLMLAIVSTALAKKMEWEIVDVSNKFTLASLFHDMSLPASVAEVEINGDPLVLSPIDRKIYLEHPERSARFFNEFLDFSGDIQHIIMEHHELPKGTGFPRSLKSTNLHVLSIVFIVAHAFVNEVYKNNFDSQLIKKSLDKIRFDLADDRFLPMIDALSKLII